MTKKTVVMEMNSELTDVLAHYQEKALQLQAMVNCRLKSVETYMRDYLDVKDQFEAVMTKLENLTDKIERAAFLSSEDEEEEESEEY